MMQQKRLLRRELQRRRDALDAAWRAEASGAICQQLTTLPVYQAAQVVHCYLPIRSEVDTRPLLQHALAHRRRVVVPVVVPGLAELTHSWLASLAEADLETGAFGVLQPRTLHPAHPGAWHLVCVPLLAFNRRGQRLGYGKGYYDRLLTVQAAQRVPAVGVAFAMQEVADLPTEPHDTALDWIVTEREVIAARA